MAAAALGFGSRRGFTSNRNTGSTSHRAGTAAASSLKQNQSITEADETPSSQSEQLLNRVSDDLTAKMRAWALARSRARIVHQGRRTFKEAPASKGRKAGLSTPGGREE